MEILEMAETWTWDTEKHEPGAFASTKFTLKSEDSRYYYAASPKRHREKPDLDYINQLTLHSIPTEEIFPNYEEGLTQVPDHLRSTCYVKRPCLIEYEKDDILEIRSLALLVMQELKICERLRPSPHKNIAPYLGCLVEDRRIKGLCFPRYVMTLKEYVATEAAKTMDVEKCVEGIRNGIQHLHSIGLVHNDINPANIMLQEDGEPVIIDFDSCAQVDGRLGLKGGSWGWALKESEKNWVSRKENDMYGLRKVEEFISSSLSSY